MGVHEMVPSLHGVRVLVVDDRSDDLEVMSLMLETLGAEVEGAASAAEAFEVISRSRPDVMVADILMPGEDGIAFARRLRGVDARGPLDLPSIAVSACATTSASDRPTTASAWGGAPSAPSVPAT